jgi:hypothetical protein
VTSKLRSSATVLPDLNFRSLLLGDRRFSLKQSLQLIFFRPIDPTEKSSSRPSSKERVRRTEPRSTVRFDRLSNHNRRYYYPETTIYELRR